MKRLTCEMCGGTDLVKQDGVFVCQQCGCKYSVEEAKKMMVEGVVQVEGTVKVDNSELIQNYLSMAKRAHESDNEKEAEEYANKALEIDPKNHAALYIKGISAGWQTGTRNNRISEAIDYFSQAIVNCPEGEELIELKSIIAKDISMLSIAMMQLRCKNYAQNPSVENANSIRGEASNTLRQTLKLLSTCGVLPDVFRSQVATEINDAAVDAFNEIWSDYTNDKPIVPLVEGSISASLVDRSTYAIPSEYDWRRFTERGDACIKVLETAIMFDEDDDADDAIRYESIINIAEMVRDSHSIAYMPGNQYFSSKWVKQYTFTPEAISTRNKMIENWKKEKRLAAKRAREKRIAKYWDDHTGEKEKLEKRIAILDKEITSLKESQEYRSTQSKINELDQRIASLANELASMGPVKRKRAKKKYDPQLESLKNSKSQLLGKSDCHAQIKLKEEELQKAKKELDNPFAR